jgi:hypothetical protein
MHQQVYDTTQSSGQRTESFPGNGDAIGADYLAPPESTPVIEQAFELASCPYRATNGLVLVRAS